MDNGRVLTQPLLSLHSDFSFANSTFHKRHLVMVHCMPLWVILKLFWVESAEPPPKGFGFGRVMCLTVVLRKVQNAPFVISPIWMHPQMISCNCILLGVQILAFPSSRLSLSVFVLIASVAICSLWFAIFVINSLLLSTAARVWGSRWPSFWWNWQDWAVRQRDLQHQKNCLLL